jgi:UDP-perosamine 4-acetyltransferase
MKSDVTENRNIVVVGAGGHAQVVLDALRLSSLNVIGFADPNRVGQSISGFPVLGDDDWLLAQDWTQILLANAIGSTGRPDARAAIFDKFKSNGFSFATLRHPSAVLAENVHLQEGAQVMAGVTIQPGVRLGMNTIVNTGAAIDHFASIDDHCHIAPGATLCGDVTIGARSHIGAGSTIIQSVSIGENCVIGAGAVVLGDVPGGATVAGNPATVRTPHQKATSR